MEAGSELKRQSPKCEVCMEIQSIVMDYTDAELTRRLLTYDKSCASGEMCFYTLSPSYFLKGVLHNIFPGECSSIFNN